MSETPSEMSEALSDLAQALGGADGALVPGDVMHARMGTPSHRFSYKVFSLLVDVDRLDDLDARIPGFAHNRFALASVHDRDHGARDGSPIGPHIRDLMAKAGLPVPDGRVLLLCYPRILGYVFNPLAVYYVFDADGALAGLVYEVRNTFGEMHAYVAPILPGERRASGIRQTRRKLFFVSPFIDMDMVYHFRMAPPDKDIRVRILETANGEPLLAATFSGAQIPFTANNLMRQCLRIPLLTVKVISAIHFEALRLWIKGAPFFRRSAPPEPVSFVPGNAHEPDSKDAACPTPPRRPPMRLTPPRRSSV